MIFPLREPYLPIRNPNHPFHPRTFDPEQPFRHGDVFILVGVEMQRRFLARERMEVWGGEGEGDGVGEGAVGEGCELCGYGAVEAVWW